MITLFDLPLFLSPLAGCMTGFTSARQRGLSDGLTFVGAAVGLAVGFVTIKGVQNGLGRGFDRFERKGVLHPAAYIAGVWVIPPLLSWYLATFCVELLQRIAA